MILRKGSEIRCRMQEVGSDGLNDPDMCQIAWICVGLSINVTLAFMSKDPGRISPPFSDWSLLLHPSHMVKQYWHRACNTAESK